VSIPNQRHLFDIPDDVTYLNCASYAPLLRESVAAGEKGVARKAHPWATSDQIFDKANADVEQLRGMFAQMIGATADDIAITPSTSYGIATAAANLAVKPGQAIVVLEQQFPSNFHPWRQLASDTGARLTQVTRPSDSDWTSAILAQLGPDTAPDTAPDAATNPAIVALPPCHWTDGARIDLVAIGARCREIGAAFVVDATQYIGAAPLDIAAIQPDFLTCSGYKWLLCPYTLAFLYAAPHRQQGRPLELRTDSPVDNARRYDMGEYYNFINIPMANAALRQVQDWTPDAISRTLAPLTQRVADGARERGLIVPPDAHRAPHFIGVRFPGDMPSEIDKKLANNNVFTALRGDALRISPHLFCDTGDIGRFFSLLDQYM
jgi:selenocysteine lyase/cysteine desulfurase